MMRDQRAGRDGRRGRGRALGALAFLMAATALAPQAAAQDRVLDALREQRLRARAAQVLGEIGPAAPAFGPEELAVDWVSPRRLSPQLPTTEPPQVRLPPMAVVPPRPEPPPRAPMELTEVLWQRVPFGQEAAFIARFGEALWTSANRFARTEIDTMATPEVRARLHATFGMPTRSPVARSAPEATGGSPYVQFEYWFVVNDSIPFVVMDTDGPFGRGAVIVGDEVHGEILGALKEDLTARLLAQPRLMPYVDYYQSRERGRWYRTGFDGERYYVLETERPRWARQSAGRERWYDFR